MGSENITLVGALAIAISAMAGALIWVTVRLLKSKDKHIADKDILIKLINDNTDSHNNLKNAIDNQVKASDKAANVLNDLQVTILKAMIKNKHK